MYDDPRYASMAEWLKRPTHNWLNDAGFWLIKEYLGTTVGQNFKTWSLMECVLSLTALAGVMLASVFI